MPMLRVATRNPARRSDTDILTQIAEGDLAALGFFFDRYATDVRGFVSRLGVPAGDVDDLVQSTFLLVLRAAPKFRDHSGHGSARAWLLGLASNLVWRHRRSLGRAASRAMAWALCRAPQRAPTPVEALEGTETAGRAQRALGRLTPRHRETFILVVLEGVSGDDAAAMLQVPVATLWTRVHRARRELRKDLLGEAP
jgi:RNA polymerase sigma-70 factor (ECF subfamily)